MVIKILQEKGKLSQRTNQVVNNSLTSVLKEHLAPKTEFWESGKTLRVLGEESYFKEKEESDVQWPEVLKPMLADSKFISYDELVCSCFLVCLWAMINVN